LFPAACVGLLSLTYSFIVFMLMRVKSLCTRCPLFWIKRKFVWCKL